MANCVVCTTDIRDDARFCPSCGAEQPRPGPVPGSGDDPFVGQTVARNFKIESLLGVGGMGKVYKARQLSLDKVVVIKILHDHFRDDAQLVQRFQREARAASRLNHPNSIQVIDFGQDESGVLYMAIEYLEGQDLFSVLRQQGALPAERIAKIMVQVCSALAEAHDQHVVHRDLKPENIMVEERRGQRDFVKVLDFGIAKIQDPAGGPGQALTQAGMVCGTPEYMSPEQARGLELDARSDLYSLGVLTYQLATEELPFSADTPIGIVTKHILEAAPSPRLKRPDIPEALESIILRAMAKEPGERFQNAVEMGDAFEAMLRAPTGAAVLAAPTALPSGTQVGMPVVSPAAPSVGGPASSAAHPLAPASSTEDAQPVVRTLRAEEPPPSRSATAATPAGVLVTPTEGAVTAPPGASPVKWVALVGLVVLAGAGGAAWALWGGADAPAAPKPPAASGAVVATDAPPAGDVPTADGVNAAGPDAGAPPEQVAATDGKGLKNKTNSAEAPARTGAPAGARGGAPAERAASARRPRRASEAAPKPDAPKGERDNLRVAELRGMKGVKPVLGAREGRRLPQRENGDADGAAEAKALHQQANALAVSSKRSDRERAYRMLRQAMELDPSNADPLQAIAFIHKRNGNDTKACNAMKMYVTKKGVSRARGESLLKMVCE